MTPEKLLFGCSVIFNFFMLICFFMQSHFYQKVRAEYIESNQKLQESLALMKQLEAVIEAMDGIQSYHGTKETPDGPSTK